MVRLSLWLGVLLHFYCAGELDWLFQICLLPGPVVSAIFAGLGEIIGVVCAASVLEMCH